MIKCPGLGNNDTNRILAEGRLLGQLRRYRAHPELLQEYDRTIREYFNENHAERVPSSEEPLENVYFLPHHAVVQREAVTTKVRLVFKAASHLYNRPSLNSVLEKGSSLNADLLERMITFRRHPTADIQKAYQ